MFERHSSIGHAAYHDLKQAWLAETTSDLRGTARKEMRAGRAYWYDVYRVGTSVRKKYIGEDSAELRQRLESENNTAVEAATARKKSRSRLVRLLRAEGFASMDGATGSLLNAMSRAGVFRLGGTVIGTQAFRMYEAELGVRYGFDQMAQTGDIDIASFQALSLALGDTVETPLAEVLADFEFTPAPSVNDHRTWRWRQTRNEMLVEFLTPSFEEDEGIKPLKALGVDAQSLHYLNYLLAHPIKAVGLYRDGVLVQIPRPERFAIHKLIVSDRRRGGTESLKSQKDVAQAAFLIERLHVDRPDELAEAFADAMNAGPRWQARLENTLGRYPRIKDWLSSVSQL